MTAHWRSIPRLSSPGTPRGSATPNRPFSSLLPASSGAVGAAVVAYDDAEASLINTIVWDHAPEPLDPGREG
ncbi:MAG: hypothetical protein CME06_02660 [Gemmatimonadetes bacterium]|nr:hypothetical protein [Gemmatimonadota bacterium]